MDDRNIAATYVLTDAEKASVEKLIRSMVPPYRPEVYDAFVSGCNAAAASLPQGVHQWRDQVRERRVGLIRNLPLDQLLPATPTVRYAADDLSMLADSVIGTLSALFGTVYTIEGKGTGRHIHNMYPVIGDEYTQLASSSKVELEWHVEEAFHPARPCWLSLLCLRGDSEAATTVARARDLQLDPDTARVLRECRFKLRIDETYGDRAPSEYVFTSVLNGPVNDPEIILDPAYTVFEDDVETEVVAAVGRAAEQVHGRFTLSPGDLLVFDNRRVVHGRTSFLPRLDGTDRWLKRVFVLNNEMWTSRLSGGVIPIAFS